MPEKDYYNILGVDRAADSKEIHQAYRRKARELHPDKNKGAPEAEDEFKRVGEAYRILSDPKKRKQYDMFGSVGGDFAPPPGWSPGGGRYSYGNPYDINSTADSDGDFNSIFEEIFGGSRQRGRRGSGSRQQTSARRGSDVEVELKLKIKDLFDTQPRKITVSMREPCSACSGTGKRERMICAGCKGSGHVAKRKNFKVKIPPGLRAGQIIRLQGQGNAAPGDGLAGDLLIRLNLQADPKLKINGDDVETELFVPDYLAALGGQTEVDGPQGKLALTLPAGTASGKTLKIQGKGLPKKNGGYGNLYVKVMVKVPQDLSPQQRELYEKLKKLNT
ncbi:J domain-containing protein [bacterium]|nr:J domain-containing protein [bacterium]